MLNRIFPKQADNTYRGHWLAIGMLALIVLARLAMGANSIINTRDLAMSADGIPLDRYNAGGAEAVIAEFALLGLFLLLTGLLGAVVLIRYRALIPFMYLVLLIQQLGSRAIITVHPIARSGVDTSQIGSIVVLSILAMTIVGFVLSLLNKSDAKKSDVPERSLAEREI